MKMERGRGTQKKEVEIVGVEIFWTYIKVKADTFVLFIVKIRIKNNFRHNFRRQVKEGQSTSQ